MENSRFKFRAWDKANNRFVNHNQWLNNTEVSASVLVQSILTINHQEWVIMQYIGLKDKNGVEIYEGDIISQISTEGEEVIHIIGYETFEASFVAYFKKYYYTDMGFCGLTTRWIDRKEVIGNIYENPELLEDKQ